jgi:A/G-specific adenine glycosylase
MRPELDVVIGIVCRGDRVLVCQRPADTTFPGYWEFPGGKREPGETLEQCLARELREELAIGVHPVAALDPIEHDYPTARVRLHPYLCTHATGEPRPLACQRFEWVEAPHLRAYRFPPANDGLIEQVIERLASSPMYAIARVEQTSRGLRSKSVCRPTPSAIDFGGPTL